MGTPDIQTPHLNQLANDRVYFSECLFLFAQFVPFSIDFLTGICSHQTRSYNNHAKIPSKRTTLADEFNRTGYQTSYVGKWHIGGTGNKPIPQTFTGDLQTFSDFNATMVTLTM